MKNYVGRKIRGFKFEDGTDGVRWNEDMVIYIGEVGKCIRQNNRCLTFEFDDTTWGYPISLIEPHLIEDETPEIPQLGEGVLMQVSDNEKYWTQAYIIAKLADGRFIDRGRLSWKHAYPIPQLPKYTHAELVEKIGHDFEIIK
jgi:hypothetical protein